MSGWGAASLLVVALAARVLFFSGLRGSDDLGYLALASARAGGAPALPEAIFYASVTELRPAFTAGIAVGLRLLGLGEEGLFAYPFVCSLALAAVLYAAARRWLGPAEAMWAGWVAALLPGFVLGASSLYPDTPMVLWVTVAHLLLWGAPSWKLPRLAALASGTALAFAAQHKETALLAGASLAWLALTRPRRGLAVWAVAGFLGLLAAGWGGYFGASVREYVGGTRAYQKAVDMGTTAPVHLSTMGTTSALPRRLLWDFTSLLFSPVEVGSFLMWGGVAWLALAGAVLALRTRSAPLLGCAAWALLSFLALDAAGVPGQGYYPAHPVAPRYLILVMPPAVLLAGTALARLARRLPRASQVPLAAVALVAACAFNLATSAPNRSFDRAVRFAAEGLRREKASEVWTDARTGVALRFFLGAGPDPWDAVRAAADIIHIHPDSPFRKDPRVAEGFARFLPGGPSFRLLDGAPAPPPGAFVVLNGPVLRFQSERVPSAGWAPVARLQVAGLFGRGASDPARWVSLHRVGSPAAVPVPRGDGGITPRQRLVAAVLGVGLILFVFELVRRRKLREEYSWLWMLSASVILLFALCHPALRWVTELIGAGLPTSTLFFFGLFFLILTSIHYAVKISRLTLQVKNLMQELAILRERLDRERGEGAGEWKGKRP